MDGRPVNDESEEEPIFRRSKRRPSTNRVSSMGFFELMTLKAEIDKCLIEQCERTAKQIEEMHALEAKRVAEEARERPEEEGEKHPEDGQTQSEKQESDSERDSKRSKVNQDGSTGTGPNSNWGKNAFEKTSVVPEKLRRPNRASEKRQSTMQGKPQTKARSSATSRKSESDTGMDFEKNDNSNTNSSYSTRLPDLEEDISMADAWPAYTPAGPDRGPLVSAMEILSSRQNTMMICLQAIQRSLARLEERQVQLQNAIMVQKENNKENINADPSSEVHDKSCVLGKRKRQ
ncbi:hypothetical protein L228DRAFT_284509 [Xylona heveae TC161]|uniref:Uncharacterized protein n=1 Tax=Xylona heveae (strain CBS 132557 / TC161) TaxID=1328760 RepID=A0A165AIL6_XYLHT|nr:hypothetical protein L228DRAFT_284509 [Xylona heveae TC161]KZF20544.1 hypothetical protein L228DRAFT_284509 [Xylona heveae TC161]